MLLAVCKPEVSMLQTPPISRDGTCIGRRTTRNSPTMGDVVENLESTARDHLANERTFLAWVRTALGLVGLGVVIEHLAEHGLAEQKIFYDAPFVDIAPAGPHGLFTDDEYDRLIAVLQSVRSSAEVILI